MVKKIRPKKHLYWHSQAKVLLEHGMSPTNVAKALKAVYPQGDITGRHVGGYKRRLINDDMLQKDLPTTADMQTAYAMVEGLVGDEDKFIYDCAIGSAKRTLKCFEYKMLKELVGERYEEDIEEWLSNTNHTTQT